MRKQATANNKILTALSMEAVFMLKPYQNNIPDCKMMQASRHWTTIQAILYFDRTELDNVEGLYCS